VGGLWFGFRAVGGLCDCDGDVLGNQVFACGLWVLGVYTCYVTGAQSVVVVSCHVMYLLPR